MWFGDGTKSGMRSTRVENNTFIEWTTDQYGHDVNPFRALREAGARIPRLARSAKAADRLVSPVAAQNQ